VGNRERVKFWSDLWCGDSSLKEAFPALFSVASNKEAAVVDYMQIRHGNLHWEVTFVRNLQDWELESLVSFLDRIYSVSLNVSGMDQMCWQRDSKTDFSVNLYYRCNCAVSLERHLEVQSPSLSSFLSLDGCLGEDLRKRRVVLVDWCCLVRMLGNHRTIFFCIVLWQSTYGTLF
jgi:hypothetical protein